jgi:hypothetical protein
MLFHLFHNIILDISLILLLDEGKHKIGITQGTTNDSKCIKCNLCIIINT